METDTIDISGIDKVKLLKALWSNMQPASFYIFSSRSPPPFNEDDAKEAVKKDIDYFCGRCIKTDISGDSADPWGYDRDAGKGAFERIVESLR